MQRKGQMGRKKKTPRPIERLVEIGELQLEIVPTGEDGHFKFDN